MQINRLFELVYLLLNQPSITAGEVARRFEVSVRTVYRDVELLSAAGIPIYMTKGRGGGIALLPDFVLNKTVLTQGEKTNILAALRGMEAVSPEQADTAVQKLSSLFGPAQSDWVEVDFSNWANGEGEAETFAILKQAILSRHQVEFLYHGGEGSQMRLVEPLKLCFKERGWYLYAHCTLRGDGRFFKLRRIRNLRQTDCPFDRQPPARVLEGSRFQDDFVLVRLWIAKEMAYRVLDEFSTYEQQPDGSFVVELPIPKGEWVYHYLATYGEHCRVLAPESVRLEIKEKLKKTLAQYD